MSPVDAPLASARPLARGRGYLFGHFDLIQVGDVDLIQQARRQCMHLTVGVVTDAYLLEQTGQAPVVRQHERLEIVRHLRDVDGVRLHDSDELTRLRPELGFAVVFLAADGLDAWARRRIEAEVAAMGSASIDLAPVRQTQSELVRVARQRLDGRRAA
jgi:glycerol-3-phosphate cytidylyltransferase